jgi:hypothetical protein
MIAMIDILTFSVSLYQITNLAFNAVHCRSHMAREGRATGFSGFIEGGPSILP